MTSPKLVPYLEAVRRYVPGGAVEGLGASAWAQGKLLERIAAHLSDRPSREELLTGLYSLRGETLGGLVPPLTFPRGPHGNVNQCVVPLRFSGGKFVPKDADRFFCPPGFVPGSGA